MYDTKKWNRGTSRRRGDTKEKVDAGEMYSSQCRAAFRGKPVQHSVIDNECIASQQKSLNWEKI